MNVNKIQSLLLATIMVATLAAKKDKDSVLDSINQRTAYIAKTVTTLEEQQACSTVIMQSDVGTSGYVISSPGAYCLGEDILFNPADPATFNPVTFTGGGGSGAAGFAAVSDGVVRGVFMTDFGSGYTSPPTPVFGGSGSGAEGVVGYAIISIPITSGGSGYTTATTVALNGIEAPSLVPVVTSGAVTSVVGFTPGIYAAPPTVTFISSSGTGATAGTPVLSTSIGGVIMTAGGSGYQDTVQAAVTIKCSGVTFDLQGHALSQFVPANSSAQVPFVCGILVPDPMPDGTSATEPNVVIPAGTTTEIGLESPYIIGNNGIISDFSMFGIRVFAHISDVAIMDLTVKNCGALASRALGRPTTSGLTYLPHDQTTAIPGSSPFGPSFTVGGIALGESVTYGKGPSFFTDVPTDQLNVVNRTENVRLNNVNCINNFMFGGSKTCITNLTINNSHFDYTWTDDPGSNTVGANYGALPAFGMVCDSFNGNTDPNNVNVQISNSTFNSTSLNGDYTTPVAIASPPFLACGYDDSRSKNITISNCQFNGSSCTFPNAVSITGVTVTSRAGGFEAGSLEDVLIQNCNFDGAFNLGAINGWHMSGTTLNEPIKSAKAIKLINCTSNDHQARTDLILPAPPVNTRTVIGYVLDYMQGFYMDGCTSSNLYYGGPCSGASFSAAFAPASSSNVLAAECTDWVMKNCQAARVQAVNGGLASGFNNFVATGNTFNSLLYDNCVSTGHQALLASVYPTWSSSTTYAAGAQASLVFTGSTVNYVSLINGNHGNNPAATPADWSVINTAPDAWNVGTTYNLGQQVSFTDSTGHTNEYISTINNNLGNYPNASGQAQFEETVISTWLQTNVYPTWNSSATYTSGMIVGYQGVNYRSLISNNTGNTPNLASSDWTTNTTVTQAVGVGFYSQQALNTATQSGGPEMYRNCVASFNQGLPGPVVLSGIARYTAGFEMYTGQGAVYSSCISEDNSGYGIILAGNCAQCVVRDCRADNNANDGFADLGLSTTTTPTAVNPGSSLFENNHAFNNAGNDATYAGYNSNYNVQVAAGVNPPLLEVQMSNPAASYIPNSPYVSYYPNVSNISTIR